jgi:hypothetical protein
MATSTGSAGAGNGTDGSGGGQARIHVAAVYSGEGVRFLTAASTADGLTARIARYVERNAALLLYPDAADEVERLLAAGELARGVELYFDRVGARWEREQLRREVVRTRG